jgi:hypothetical protein
MTPLRVWCVANAAEVVRATRPADGSSACPTACLQWSHARERLPVGPALAEDVCYRQAVCYHPVSADEPCAARWTRCLRADDEMSKDGNESF